MADAERAARIGAIVAGVVRQTVRDAGASGIVLVDDGSPEATLIRRWCSDALGGAVHAVDPQDAGAVVEWAQRHGAAGRDDAAVGPDGSAAREDAGLGGEAHRFLARCVARRAGALVASPVNKTALLLGGEPPPEPLLPLGDLYAGQVRALAGGWSGPAAVRELADRAGGIDMLDAALVRLVDERRSPADALAELPDGVADAVLRAFEAGRFGRRRLGLVPKLGARTPGIDLFA